MWPEPDPCRSTLLLRVRATWRSLSCSRARVCPHRACTTRAHEYYIVCRLDGDDAGDVNTCACVCARACVRPMCACARVYTAARGARVRACACVRACPCLYFTNTYELSFVLTVGINQHTRAPRALRALRAPHACHTYQRWHTPHTTHTTRTTQTEYKITLPCCTQPLGILVDTSLQQPCSKPCSLF